MPEFYVVTNPTHVFVMPDDIPVEDLQWLRWTYAQAGRIILEKTLEDCDVDDQTLSITLTQAETKLFDVYLPIKVQLRVGYNGEAIPSEEYTLAIRDSLNKEVITV